MMSPADRLSPTEEKDRYDQHKNDVNDQGYRNFVSPLVGKVLKTHPFGSSGLDYGSGSGPVAAVLLREKGYEVSLFDPFYHPDKKVLQRKYNFIICSEVIEHFYRPAEEFRLLSSLLLPGGSLFCMSELLPDQVNFTNWYYKNDPTHVFFYHLTALEWIRKKYSFSSLQVEKRLIHFKL